MLRAMLLNVVLIVLLVAGVTAAFRNVTSDPANRALAQADLLLHRGQRLDALEALDLAVRLDPDSTFVRQKRAVALMDLDRNFASLADWNAILAERPKSAAALYYRGVALSNLGRLDEAASDLQQALDLKRSPRSYLLAALAEVEAARGRWQAAAEHMQAALTALDSEPGYLADEVQVRAQWRRQLRLFRQRAQSGDLSG